MNLSGFYVIAVISNPVRYKSRVALFQKFQKEMIDAGVELIVVEQAYGERPFEVSHSSHPHHLQIRTTSEIWHKEAMINLGVNYLTTQIDPNWKYMAWIDADISFTRPDWVVETIHQLQHHDVVQMFQTAIDLGPKGEAFGRYEGFAWAYNEGRFNSKTTKYTSFHPGYAWAITRPAYEAVGGLIETAVLGAGDRHMAYGLVGMMKDSLNEGLHPNYAVSLLEWEKRAERYIQRDVGYVAGNIIHHWHGKKADRRYHDRWKILIENQFDPNMDLKRDSQGLLTLDVISPRQMKLRDDIRKYFRARNEDSIDTV